MLHNSPVNSPLRHPKPIFDEPSLRSFLTGHGAKPVGELRIGGGKGGISTSMCVFTNWCVFVARLQKMCVCVRVCFGISPWLHTCAYIYILYKNTLCAWVDLYISRLIWRFVVARLACVSLKSLCLLKMDGLSDWIASTSQSMMFNTFQHGCITIMCSMTVSWLKLLESPRLGLICRFKVHMGRIWKLLGWPSGWVTGLLSPGYPHFIIDCEWLAMLQKGSNNSNQQSWVDS